MKIPPVKIYFPEDDRKEIVAKIEEVLVTGQLTLGKNGKEFEDKFAAYLNTKYAVAVNSGTSSIEIPLRIFGVDGKEVLVSSNTFFATPAAVLHAGGRVRFADVEASTFSVTAEGIEERITEDTVGVIVVHIGGMVTPQMPEIQALCKEKGLFLFEDAAHAHGSSLNGKMAGTFGDAASFSFYPTKVMTSAEGGMIVTNDEKLSEEALIYRDQGKAGFLSNFHTHMGYNWRMSEPHAIIGLSQFQRLEEFIIARNKIARVYDEGLKAIPKVTPLALPSECRSNYYKYIALLDEGINRIRLKKMLREEYEVGLSGEVYDTPCHRQPVFEPYSDGEFPVAEDICARHICLPIFATMTEDEAEYVLSSLAEALRKI